MTDINDQHFLKSEKVIKRMIELADVQREDIVMDLGAGAGAITKHIPGCKSIIAVENDSALAAKLRKLSYANITVLEADAMRVPLNADKIISNPPFSLLEAITYHLFRSSFKRAVFLVPVSFAEKLDSPDTVLGLLAKAFFDIEMHDEVDADALEPAPDTSLCLIVLNKKNDAQADDFFVQQLFLQRDKKTKNALRETYVRWKKGTKRQGEEFVEKLDLPLTILQKDVPHLEFEDYEIILKRIHEKTVE